MIREIRKVTKKWTVRTEGEIEKNVSEISPRLLRENQSYHRHYSGSFRRRRGFYCDLDGIRKEITREQLKKNGRY